LEKTYREHLRSNVPVPDAAAKQKRRHKESLDETDVPRSSVPYPQINVSLEPVLSDRSLSLALFELEASARTND
jgi:hypothetical protein